MQFSFAYLLSKWRYLAGAIAVAFLAWFFLLRGGGASVQTLTVQPSVFAQQIVVSGTVTAAQDVDLGFTQSGRISGVYAAVGQTVPEGKLLAQIENGDLRAALAQAQAALEAQQAKLASLEAGTRPEQLAVTQAQIDSDSAALVQANTAVVNALEGAYTQSDDAVHNKADQFFSNARTATPSLSFSTSDTQLRAQVEASRAAAEGMLASWQSETQGLDASGDLSAAERDAQQNLSAVAALLSKANAALNSAIYSSSVTSSTISGYITSVAVARGNVDTAQSALTSAITAQANAASALEKDKKSLALEQAGSTREDIDGQKAQVAAAQANVQSAQAQLQKTLVVAPLSGTVTKMDAKVGEIVSPNTSEISMISDGLFQIDTYVPEVEITGLAPGDRATTTLDAYGSSVEFSAKVIAIDPAETVVNGVSTYKTTLQFLAADPRVKSGMTANVTITTKATPDALVVPRGAVFQKGGQSVVQLLRRGAIVDVPVATAPSESLGNIQVLSGLSAGDSVVLNPDVAK